MYLLDWPSIDIREYMEKEMIIVKFGGSLITDKSSNTPKINDLKLGTIGKILNQTKYKVIIVHGAGSFGHPIAKKYNIAKGIDGNPEQKKAINNTREQVQELNNILREYLMKENIDTIPIIPSSTMITNGDKEILNFPFALFDEVLNKNKIPVTFGDITQDKKQGISVLSGDNLMMELTKYYKPLYSIFVMDHPGVFDGNPEEPGSKILPIVNNITLKTLKKQKNAQNIADVTGGLIGKIECALDMAQHSEIWITNLDFLIYMKKTVYFVQHM